MSLRLLRERPSEFETAKSRWAEVSERRRELKDKLAGAEASLGLAANLRKSMTCHRRSLVRGPPRT